MRTLLSRITPLLIVGATGAACGGGGGTEPPVFTTVEVTPATATLFTVAPGNTVTLSAVAKDQNGQTIAGAASAGFASDNSAVADVSDNGTVTAVAAGTAQITASLTAGGATKAGTATVTVQAAPAGATVLAPSLAFQPAAVEVQAGGTVTWTFGPIPHTVTFTTGGAPPDVPDLQDGSAARTFPTNGTFNYHCTIHPQMTAVVHVH